MAAKWQAASQIHPDGRCLLIARLELPGIPKSLNAVGSRGSHFAFANEKKKWEGMIFIALNQAKVPRGLIYIEATAVLYPPTKHKRDEGNFRMMLEKALGDVLQVGGWLADDSTDQFRFGRLEFAETKPKPGLTVLMLECHTDESTIPNSSVLEDSQDPPLLKEWFCPSCDSTVAVPEDTRQPYCANEGHPMTAMRPVDGPA